MFDQINRNWRAARGGVLKREAFETLLRLESYGDIFNGKAALQMAVAFDQAVAPFSGTFESVSSSDKVRLAHEIRAEAARAFESNMPASYGMALFGIMLEAGETPGEDAAEAFQVLWETFRSAVSLKHELDKAELV